MKLQDTVFYKSNLAVTIHVTLYANQVKALQFYGKRSLDIPQKQDATRLENPKSFWWSQVWAPGSFHLLVEKTT